MEKKLEDDIDKPSIRNTLNSMKSALNSGIPFIVGILIFPSFMTKQVANTGMVPMPTSREQYLGGHAVCCVGYDDSKKCWLMRNSWGTSWGVKGYFYLPYAYLTNTNYTSDLWCLLTITNPYQE